MFKKPEHSTFKGRYSDGGTLILIRGCPGSGKSTLAKSLSCFHPPSMVHLEADMYFERNGGGYLFNPEDLHRAHRWCLETTKIMLNTRSHCVVSNTFTRYAEMVDYVNYALAQGVGLEIYTLTSEFQNQHNVPEEKLRQMRDRFHSHEFIMKCIQETYAQDHLCF